jgi:hypothetical protein
MSFIIPELIVESLIRDGLLNIKTKPEIIDDIFSQLTKGYNRKYGTAELEKIKAFVQKDFAVVYSYSQVDHQKNTISIMVGSDNEDKGRDSIGDYREPLTVQIADPVALAALVKVDDIEVLSYDPTTGKITVADTTDLSEVYRGLIFVDNEDNEFPIIGGINNEPGDKSFFIQKQAEIVTDDPTSSIKSSLDYEQYEVKGITSDVTLVLGVHSKDVLTTKYMYVLLKYFLVSRKADMVKRGLIVSTLSGSDFHRDSQFAGDQVYVRFLTITGKVEDLWRSDQVQLIDNIEIDCEPVE